MHTTSARIVEVDFVMGHEDEQNGTKLYENVKHFSSSLENLAPKLQWHQPRSKLLCWCAGVHQMTPDQETLATVEVQFLPRDLAPNLCQNIPRFNGSPIM